uniref:Uncharacterized protein n=1 Tax=Cacopsylla melanoneura TaxID=428564 RepID=A0A8D8R7H6_9HEMI
MLGVGFIFNLSNLKVFFVRYYTPLSWLTRCLCSSLLSLYHRFFFMLLFISISLFISPSFLKLSMTLIMLQLILYLFLYFSCHTVFQLLKWVSNLIGIQFVYYQSAIPYYLVPAHC